MAPGTLPTEPVTEESLATKYSVETQNRPTLERILAQDESASLLATTQLTEEGVIVEWFGRNGTLADGRKVCCGDAFSVQPQPQDRVLITKADGKQWWVMAILTRSRDDDTRALFSTDKVTVQAEQTIIVAERMQITATDFLSQTQNRHAIEENRVAHVNLRVVEVGTDIKTVSTAEDDTKGILLQRLGRWIFTALNDARLKAKSFIYD